MNPEFDPLHRREHGPALRVCRRRATIALGAAVLLVSLVCPLAGNAVPTSDTATAPTACADFLADARRKPRLLQFQKCERTSIHGTAAFRATYRVPGTGAAAVESQLVRSVKMPRMRYMCCGWESMSRAGGITQGHFYNKGARFDVSMSSGDTPVRERRRWVDIATFEVSVVSYLELP